MDQLMQTVFTFFWSWTLYTLKTQSSDTKCTMFGSRTFLTQWGLMHEMLQTNLDIETPRYHQYRDWSWCKPSQFHSLIRLYTSHPWNGFTHQKFGGILLWPWMFHSQCKAHRLELELSNSLVITIHKWRKILLINIRKLNVLNTWEAYVYIGLKMSMHVPYEAYFKNRHAI